jgi:hypothetical protein
MATDTAGANSGNPLPQCDLLTCLCVGIVGGTACVEPVCTAIPCTTNADCGANSVCFTQGCCGAGSFCVPLCASGGGAVVARTGRRTSQRTGAPWRRYTSNHVYIPRSPVFPATSLRL